MSEWTYSPMNPIHSVRELWTQGGADSNQNMTILIVNYSPLVTTLGRSGFCSSVNRFILEPSGFSSPVDHSTASSLKRLTNEQVYWFMLACRSSLIDVWVHWKWTRFLGQLDITASLNEWTHYPSIGWRQYVTHARRMFDSWGSGRGVDPISVLLWRLF